MRRCIHCHHILEGIRKSYKKTRLTMPDRIRAPYPTTGTVGFSLDTRKTSTISQVLKKSPAEAAGLSPGDKIVRAGGQIILSIADVEWAIYSAPDEGVLDMEIRRGDESIKASIRLRSGWREDD